MANNFIVKDAALANVTISSVDTGTFHIPQHGLMDYAGTEALGIVNGTPASNTMLGRLKFIGDRLTNRVTLVTSANVEIDFTGGTEGTPGGSTQSVQSPGPNAVPMNTNVLPRTNGNGSTSTRVNSFADNNATLLKGSGGNLVNVDLFNVAAYDVYLKFYNKASAPSVGSDTPSWTIPIKAGQGFSREFIQGKTFSTGIAFAITKNQGDADNTAIAAGDVTGSIDWI